MLAGLPSGGCSFWGCQSPPGWRVRDICRRSFWQNTPSFSMGKFLPEGNIPRIYIVRGHVFLQLKRWWNFRFSQTERSTSTASNQWELWSHFFDFPKYPDPSKAWLFWGPYRTLPLIYMVQSHWIVQWSLDIPQIFGQHLFFLGGEGPVVL